jgi:hypothetical protein
VESVAEGSVEIEQHMGRRLFQSACRADSTATAPENKPGQAFDPGAFFHARLQAPVAEGGVGSKTIKKA